MTTNSTGLSPQECVRLLIKYRLRWLVPTLACAVLAAGYSMAMNRYWQASQAVVVRNEVSSPSDDEPGKFADLYEMRTLQETILELAKSRQVLTATMKAVAEMESETPAPEPVLKKINSLREHISILPPHGAEFGMTEVFYLSVEDKNRERSVRLVDELCRQLDARLRDLRKEQSQNIVIELEIQAKQAEAAHRVETAKLKIFETEIGLDLGELRMLHAASSGLSDLRQQAVSLEAEHRESESRVREAEQLLVVLQSAQDSPEALIAMPSSLLDSQPTLRILKEGLVEAQLRAARLTGTRTAEHPQSQAASKAVERIGSELYRELQVAVQGVEIELKMNREHTQAIGNDLTDMRRRLSSLAQNRAEYTNRVAAVEDSREVLSHAHKQLSEVRAVQVASNMTSLVTPLDRAEVGEHPVGISRASVMMVGTMGGLILGLGCLFITVPPTPNSPYSAAAAIAKNRARTEQDSPGSAAVENHAYASTPAPAPSETPVTTSSTSTPTSAPTVVDVISSEMPIFEKIDQHLAIADDLSQI